MYLWYAEFIDLVNLSIKNFQGSLVPEQGLFPPAQFILLIQPTYDLTSAGDFPQAFIIPDAAWVVVVFLRLLCGYVYFVGFLQYGPREVGVGFRGAEPEAVLQAEEQMRGSRACGCGVIVVAKEVLK